MGSKRWRAVFKGLIVPAILAVMISGLGIVSSDAAQDGVVSMWEDLLSRKEIDLQRMVEALDRAARVLPDECAVMHRRLVEAEGQLDSLVWSYRGSAETLPQLQDLLVNSRGIRVRVSQMVAPLKDRLFDLKEDEKLAGHSLAWIKAQRSVLEEVVSRNLLKSIDKYVDRLEKEQERIAGLRVYLEAELAPADTQLKKMDARIASLEREYGQRLIPHYLDRRPHLFSWQGWRQVWEERAGWRASVSFLEWDLRRVPSTAWAEVLFTALVLSAILILLGRRAVKRIVRNMMDPVLEADLNSFAAWTSVGLGLLLAVTSRNIPLAWLLKSLAAIVVTRGLAALSWALRRHFSREEIRLKNPLTRLWVLFLAAVLLMWLPSPGQILLPVWTGFLLLMFMGYRKKAEGDWPVLEWGITRGTVYGLPLLVLVSLLGWVNLSLMTATIWFIFCLDVHLAYGISRGMARLREGQPEGRAGFVIRGLSLIFAFPVVLIALLYVSLSLAAVSIGGVSLLSDLIDLKIGWDKVSFTLNRLILIVALFFITRSVVMILHEVLDRLPEMKPELKGGEVKSLKIITTYLAWFLFGMIGLYSLGFTVANLAVVGGGLSVGLGFGMQNIVNNFISGLILLFGRSIQPGDMIQVGDLKGRVQKLSIRDTLVRTSQGTSVFIPNSELISKKFVNWSHQDPRVMRQVEVRVAYGTDPRLVTEILMEVAQTHPEILEDPPPSIRFSKFADSSLDFEIRFWVDNDQVRQPVASDLHYAIFEAFQARGIEIPFRQLDVHVRPGPGQDSEPETDEA